MIKIGHGRNVEKARGIVSMITFKHHSTVPPYDTAQTFVPMLVMNISQGSVVKRTIVTMELHHYLDFITFCQL